MNIVILSGVFPPEPVVSASLSKDIADELCKQHKVQVLCPFSSRPHGFVFGKTKDPEEYDVFRLNSYTCSESKIIGRFRESYSFGKYCYKYISENHVNIDIIYASTWPLFAQYFAVRAAKKFGIPIIMHIQDVYPESLSNKYPFLKYVIDCLCMPFEKYVLFNSDTVIAISAEMKKYLVISRKVFSNNVRVIPNWQDESPFVKYFLSNNILNTSKKPFTFMYLGNIGPVAGIDLLIAAFSSFELLSTRLVIAGSGSMKNSLEKIVKNKKVQNIEFWPVPDGMVPQIQSQADVLILPMIKGAATSSIPSKLPSYMFSKKPILALVEKNSVISNVILDAKCGWQIEPGNLDNLIEIAVEIVKIDNVKLRNLGESGYRFGLMNYSKNVQLTKIVELFDNV